MKWVRFAKLPSGRGISLLRAAGVGRPSLAAPLRSAVVRASRPRAERKTVTALIWILSILLILEFVFAPVNLITGRNAPLFTEFTGIESRTAMLVVAGLDALGALLVAIGLFAPKVSVAGAVLLTALCGWYIVMMVLNGHFGMGMIGFLLFGSWAVGLLWAQLAR